MEARKIREIFIAGTGTLGARIGLQSAISGYSVTMYDIKEESLERGKKVHDSILKWILRNQLLGVNESNIEEIKRRVTWTLDINEVKKADLISESVLENREVKTSFWKELGPLCKEEAILTTNTSYMLPSWFADSSGKPNRFCAWHFHDVFHARVVDIMFHKGTDKEILQPLKEISVKLNQIPVVLNKEANGYIFNQMLGAILNTAGSIAHLDIATIQDIDRSWMGNFNLPIGPFGMMDEIGLDTVWHVCNNDKTMNSKALSNFVKPYIDQNKLGVKTGEGFYTYPNPVYKNKDFLMSGIEL